MDTKFLLAPSILACDFSDMGGALSLIEKAGGDMVHIDVMDGHFVPEITIGAPVVAALRKKTKLPFDVHLMVSNPEHFIPMFAEAGADYLTFHYEAAVHVHSLIGQIHAAGMKAGISIVPSTPVSFLTEILDMLDLVLVMTVNPGYGGQKMIYSCLEKIRTLRNLREKSGFKYIISVDGGVNGENFNQVLEFGADMIVSGSAFFNGSLGKSVSSRPASPVCGSFSCKNGSGGGKIE